VAANSFGTVFRITTWGESHGKAIGCVVDGVPAGLEITDSEIQEKLNKRAPGRSRFVSPRKEKDQVEILSGTFHGVTTGAPICLLIRNEDHDSSKYEPIQEVLRPGHAHFTFLEKYGQFDWKGGGRASARETAARVAAGAIAQKFLKSFGIEVKATLKQVGSIKAKGILSVVTDTLTDELFCVTLEDEKEMKAELERILQEGDSIGGVVECTAFGVPCGLGDPVYEKIEAKLAFALMSLPAAKAFEIGHGFEAVFMQGSEHNDSFHLEDDKVTPMSNHAGGTLGGITTGKALVVRTHFKPTSSIKKEQKSCNHEGEERPFSLPEGSRHDPCVAVRAVPVCEAMCALVLADSLLMNRLVKIKY
jgi:chorismate synthase